MTFISGTRFGRYEIRSPLGAGGMGEVYLALDAQLERTVALKILPSDVASSGERMRRFVQEAKAAAALSHPNIAHIYEVGESEGTHFIAMEYIDGETLREEIHTEKTPLNKLLKYLTQVAEGLAKAHAAGIVHRDLKPDNIMITRDGYTKILDFGLAKLIEPQKGFSSDGRSSEVATAILSQHSTPGMIMGTVGYMSPEQAQGKVREIDYRSDIFSFGCILYEAATGRKAFEGKDVLDSLHKIVHAPTPQIKDFNAAAPVELQRIVRRCLQKDPEERYQTIKDVAIELKELQREMTNEAELHYSVSPPTQSVSNMSSINTPTPFASSAGQALETKESTAARSTSSAEYLAGEIKRHKQGAVIALTFLSFIVAGIGYGIYRYSTNQKKTVQPVSAMKLTRLTTTGKATGAAISPDGKYVVYAMSDNGQQSLWMRQTATQSNVQIMPPAANVEYARLIFSPDGDYLFYVARENNDTPTLYQIPVLGGSPRKLLSNISNFMALSPDATQIVFGREFPTEGITALMISNVDGTGERRLVVRKLPERYLRISDGNRPASPAWSPDGKIIVFPVINNDAGAAQDDVVAIDVASGQEKLIDSQQFGRIGEIAWLADGSGLLVLASEKQSGGAQLWQLSYPEGELRRITNDLNRYRSISLTADSNSLVTVQFEQTASVWIAPPTDATRAKQITSGAGRLDNNLVWTPDNRIVFDSNASGLRNIWIMNADGSLQKQLTTDGGCCMDVSRDGRYIIYQSDRLGTSHIFRMDANGGNLKQLTTGSAEFSTNFSSDGQWVLYSSRDSGKFTLWRVSVDGGAPKQLTNETSFNTRVSPDGKWVSVVYREDQPNSILKIAIFPFEGGQPVKIFDNIPAKDQDIYWTPDSLALIYIDTRGGVSNLWTQPIDGGAPKQITDFKQESIFSFDYSRDSKQLALSRGKINNDVVLISNFK